MNLPALQLREPPVTGGDVWETGVLAERHA